MSELFPSLITLSNASFGYGKEPVIRGVSLEVQRGEFIGLIGPNGAGKSTLFKGMLKLLAPLAGQVTHAKEISKRIGYVPQRDQLDPIYPLSSFDVARMGATGILPWYRMADKALNDRVTAGLEKVGMTDFRDRAFAELSGGQRQRVLIARALAMEPAILVLDEPTAGIDPVAETSILELLSALNKEQGITILMVSHNISSLRHHVHRAILIKDHGILSGTAAELLHPDRIMDLLSASL